MGSLEAMASIDERAYQAELDRRLAGMIAFGEMQQSLDVPYLIKGLIERGKLHVIYGPSGHGKTFLTIDLACHIAAGMHWRGRKVKQAPVVYIAAEAGESIQTRLMAWRDKVGNGTDIPLLVWPKASDMRNAAFQERMNDMLGAAKEKYGDLGLVIVDTFSRAMPGADENSAQHVTQAIQFADKLRDDLGVAVLFVHHTGKNEEAGARGSSALKCALDYEIRVINKVAHLDKVRDGTSGIELPFNLKQVELGTDADGDPLTTCVVEHLDDVVSKKRQKPKPSPTGQIALRALELMSGVDDLPQSGAWPVGARGCAIDKWRNEVYRTCGKPHNQKRTYFSRAQDDLQSKGYVSMFDDWAWLE